MEERTITNQMLKNFTMHQAIKGAKTDFLQRVTKEECLRLVKTTEQKSNERLCLLLQTLCGTESVSASCNISQKKWYAKARPSPPVRTKPKRCLPSKNCKRNYCAIPKNKILFRSVLSSLKPGSL